MLGTSPYRDKRARTAEPQTRANSRSSTTTTPRKGTTTTKLSINLIKESKICLSFQHPSLLKGSVNTEILKTEALG